MRLWCSNRDPIPQPLADLPPAARAVREIAVPAGRGEPRQLPAVVRRLRRSPEGLGGDIRGDHRARRRLLVEDHRQTVGFLAVGTPGAPDHGRAVDAGEHALCEGLELPGMAEECRLLNREAVVEALPGTGIRGEAGDVAPKGLPAWRRPLPGAALDAAPQRM